MLIDVPKRVNIVRLRCVRLGPQRLSIAIGQGRLCLRSHYSLFTAQGCTRRARRSRPTITDHYSLITRFSVRRSRARVWSRARPWCSPGRGTGCRSGRRGPARCRANCCRRRCTRRRGRGRRRRLLVKVSRTLPGVAAYGGVRRADERSDAVPRQCGSEIVIHSSVAGNERVGLAPIGARFGEQIGLALIGVASDRGGVCGDEGSAAVEGNRVAEVGARRAVASGKLLHLAPGAVRFGKEVGRALQGMAVNSRIVSADEGRAILERDRGAKVVEQRTIACGQLLTFTPSAVRLSEHVGCALTDDAAHGGGECTDEKGIVGEHDPISEFVPRQAVACGQLLSLAPTAVRLGEQVGRTLETVVAIGAYQCSGAVERRCRAEVAVCRAVAGGDLLL